MKKSNIRIIYAVLSILFITASCDQMSHGEIVEKWHEPANTYIQMIPIIHTSGKYIYTTYVPMTVYDSEDWCIRVRGVGSKGDTISRTYYIDMSAYDTLNVGETICIDGICDEDTNNTRSNN